MANYLTNSIRRDTKRSIKIFQEAFSLRLEKNTLFYEELLQLPLIRCLSRETDEENP